MSGNIKKPCLNCVYFKACGDTMRTEFCAGRKTKSEQKIEKSIITNRKER